MKVAIIGSNGFLGRHLVDFCMHHQMEVNAFSSQDGSGMNPHTGIFSEHFSISRDVSAVVYLAQSPYYRQGPKMSWHLLQVNCCSAVKAAETARAAGVTRFIYVSSGSVYAPSFSLLSEKSPLARDNWYSLSKIHAEEALSLFRTDMDITVVRPFGIYGPGQNNMLVPNMAQSILTHKEVYLKRNPLDKTDYGGLKISLCYITDAVEIIGKLLYGSDIPYLNVAGEQPVCIKELASLVARVMKKEVLFRILDEARLGDLQADISLLQAKIPIRFTSIEEGIEKTVRSV